MQQRKNRRLAARTLNPRRSTRKKQGPDNKSVYGSKKSLTQKPDDVSGKGPTKAKVLVVHRIGFVRSGVLSLIAKSMQFAVCGETCVPGRCASIPQHRGRSRIAPSVRRDLNRPPVRGCERVAANPKQLCRR